MAFRGIERRSGRSSPCAAIRNRLRVPVAVIAVGVLVLSPVVIPAGHLSGAEGGPPQEQARIVARIDGEPLLAIGDRPENALFRVIGVALVGDALILAERSSKTLRYYDRATGELLRTTGGEGEGPGSSNSSAPSMRSETGYTRSTRRICG